MKEDEAAAILQKCIRKYLKRRKQTARIDKNSNNLRDDEKLQAKKVLGEVNLFYEKLQTNLKKKKEIRKLCADIDEVSANLRAISKLEQCKELETSFCDSSEVERIKERHIEQIRQMNLKWWEKLDIYENV